MSTLGERIVEARLSKGITQKALSAALGISPTRLNYWEKDKSEPNVNYIHRLCDILDVNGDWLLGLSGQKEKPAINDSELRELMRNPKAQEINAALYKMSDDELERVYQMFRLWQNPPQ